MNLKKLLAQVPIEVYRGSKEIEIAGICAHSKRVAPGDLFISMTGEHIEEAVAHGAVAVLTDMGNPFLKETVQLLHPHVREITGELAAAFYGHPSKKLTTIGITGTNGKTTLAYLMRHLLGPKCGLIGTIEYILGQTRYPAELTTPDAVTCHRLLAEMVAAQCHCAVMEVSSIGLDQGRVDGIDFDVAIFTNLTQDHLDYHGSMEAYADAKARLFTSLSPDATAIINLESPWAPRIVEQCRARILTYGFTSEADLWAHDIVLSSEATSFKVTYQGETQTFVWSQLGHHNILNALAALACSFSRASHLATFPGVPGRLERVGERLFVDYAHTPDALECVLTTLSAHGPVITVFGCGGDRDRAKRPHMGKVAAKYSKKVILTSDNPRSEDPLQICREIACPTAHVEIDRRKAIAHALAIAEKGDLILIAGKGHETSQVFAHRTLPFDDREVARELLG